MYTRRFYLFFLNVNVLYYIIHIYNMSTKICRFFTLILLKKENVNGSFFDLSNKNLSLYMTTNYNRVDVRNFNRRTNNFNRILYNMNIIEGIKYFLCIIYDVILRNLNVN